MCKKDKVLLPFLGSLVSPELLVKLEGSLVVFTLVITTVLALLLVVSDKTDVVLSRGAVTLVVWVSLVVTIVVKLASLVVAVKLFDVGSDSLVYRLLVVVGVSEGDVVSEEGNVPVSCAKEWVVTSVAESNCCVVWLNPVTLLWMPGSVNVLVSVWWMTDDDVTTAVVLVLIDGYVVIQLASSKINTGFWKMSMVWQHLFLEKESLGGGI